MENEINIEQELYKHFGHVKDFTLCTAIAKRFYEMGKDSNVLRNGKNWEEEPVSEELEQAAKHYLYSNILYDDVYVGNPTDKDCIECFKAGAQWQKHKDSELIFNAKEDGFRLGKATMKQQMIQKACDWQKENLLNYTYSYNGEVGIGMAEFLKHFSKAMKD